MKKKFSISLFFKRKKTTSSVNTEVDLTRVNKTARIKRWQKLFGNARQKQGISRYLEFYLFYLKCLLRNFSSLRVKNPRLFYGDLSINELLSSRKYLKRVAIFVFIFFLLGSLNIGQAYNSENYGEENFLDYGDQGESVSYLTDEEGYLIKAVPSNASGGVYVSRDELVTEHLVQSGQTLSEIAMMYGLSMNTIMWANDMWNADNLTVGRKLEIPRVDGVMYRVKKGDTIEKIASKYGINADKIRQENQLEGDMISLEQLILLPEAKPFNPPSNPIIAARESGSPVTSKTKSTIVKPPANKSKTNGKLLWPTIGRVTQGYKRSHLALDIANRAPNVPIYAATSGTVILAKSGKWNGGYGNYVKIESASGIVTLYGHMKVLYVTEGQKVTQGEVIGIMGSTGRSSGPHLHFEVVDDGVKRNPNNYF